VTAGVLLVGGLAILFTSIPDRPLLGNYRKARNMVAAAYMFFMVVNTAKYLFGDLSITDVPLLQTITLSIAISQALLFTLALLALLDIKFPSRRFIRRQMINAAVIIIAIFVVYALCNSTSLCHRSKSFFENAFYGFSLLYALLLAYYTRLFFQSYRRFRLQLDNYFSDNEEVRMRWIFFSFFAALTIGIMALITTIFMSIPLLMIFTVVFNVFYIWFAIRFINYTHRFYIIENVFDNENEVETGSITETEPENDTETEFRLRSETDLRLRSDTEFDQQASQSTIFLILEKKVEQWVNEKQFTEKGITITTLSNKLQTNRFYLSSFINTCKGKTFREWINELRIEEAKTILQQFPNMTVNDIALQIGFADKSHFIKQFSKLTGVSPKEWKKT